MIHLSDSHWTSKNDQNTSSNINKSATQEKFHTIPPTVTTGTHNDNSNQHSWGMCKDSLFESVSYLLTFHAVANTNSST